MARRAARVGGALMIWYGRGSLSRGSAAVQAAAKTLLALRACAPPPRRRRRARAGQHHLRDRPLLRRLPGLSGDGELPTAPGSFEGRRFTAVQGARALPRHAAPSIAAFAAPSRAAPPGARRRSATIAATRCRARWRPTMPSADVTWRGAGGEQQRSISIMAATRRSAIRRAAAAPRLLPIGASICLPIGDFIR